MYSVQGVLFDCRRNDERIQMTDVCQSLSGGTHSQWRSTACWPLRWPPSRHRCRRRPASGRSWSDSPGGRSAASCPSPPGNTGCTEWAPRPEGWPAGQALGWVLIFCFFFCFLRHQMFCRPLTPLETDWQSNCIHSAMSCSSLALSSSGGRSARMTWKAWGRSVLFERRQPPQCSPLLWEEKRSFSSFSSLPDKTPRQVRQLRQFLDVKKFDFMNIKEDLTPWWWTSEVWHQFSLHTGKGYHCCERNRKTYLYSYKVQPVVTYTSDLGVLSNINLTFS